MSIRDYFDRDVRLRHLRLLVAIDDAGRLTRAAQLLHVTQPALSKALAEIERSIGSPLFERTPHGLTATPAGATLVRAARAALAELERAGLELQRPAHAAARVLVVGAMPTAGWSLLSDAVARWRMVHPSATVRVVDGPTGALLPQLVAGRLDLILGARLRPAVPQGIEGLALYEDSMRLVTAPRHPFARVQSLGWERAVTVPWVVPPEGHPVRVAFDRALRRQGWPAPGLMIEALSADSVLAMVESLDAIGLTPGRFAARLKARGLVREVAPELADALSISLNVTAFVASTHHDDPMVESLVRCLREVAHGQDGKTDGMNRRRPPSGRRRG